jgi:hypothetical protein
MSAALNNTVLLIHLLVAVIGVVLYGASSFGYGWEAGGQFVFIGFICSFLASVPALIRDRKFFKKYWGFGLIGMRNRFPFQFFPARRDNWLNPLAWLFMGILFLHFFWLVIDSTTHQAEQANPGTSLRYVSLMVAIAGVLGALIWQYPPTEKPPVQIP